MKSKQLIALAGIALVLAALAAWSTRKDAARTRSTLIGGMLLPDLQARLNSAASLQLQAPAGTVTVSRIEGTWRVPGKWNYPADFGKVRDLLNKLAELKVLQSLRTTPAERAELQLLTPADAGATNQELRATRIQILDEGGKAISSLYLGKTRSQPAMGGFPDSRFVMTDAGQACLVADTFPEVTPADRDWLDMEFLSFSDLASIRITGTTNGDVHATSPSPTGEFVLQGDLPPDKEVDKTRLGQAASALGALRFDDVADPALPPDQTGLDKPVTYEALTRKGEKVTVRIGKSPSGDTRRYAAVSVSFEAPAPAPLTGTETNQVELAKARETENTRTATGAKLLNDRFSPWIYLLDSYSTETMTRGFSDLLKDKPKTQDNKEETPKAGEHHDN